jgi:hypothetical protein|tara:strand:- start:2753 stop:2866 length:114 start_codon:yes stop_codon:yes gene_type:complete
MNKQTKGYLITAAIAALVAAGVVWASNNVEVVEDAIG